MSPQTPAILPVVNSTQYLSCGASGKCAQLLQTQPNGFYAANHLHEWCTAINKHHLPLITASLPCLPCGCTRILAPAAYMCMQTAPASSSQHCLVAPLPTPAACRPGLRRSWLSSAAVSNSAHMCLQYQHQ
jgi:hypothetical protein